MRCAACLLRSGVLSCRSPSGSAQYSVCGCVSFRDFCDRHARCFQRDRGAGTHPHDGRYCGSDYRRAVQRNRGVCGVSADHRYECALDCRSQRAFGPSGADRRAHYRRLMGCGDLGLTHASLLNARPHRCPSRGGVVCPGRWRRLTVYPRDFRCHPTAAPLPAAPDFPPLLAFGDPVLPTSDPLFTKQREPAFA